MTMPSRSFSFTRPTALAALAAIGTLAAGCYYPGYYPGGGHSMRDLHTFVSTTDYPQTVQLLDLATDTVIWTINIPIGQQLVVRFYDGHDPENTERPTLMRWELMDRGRQYGELDNAMPVPDYDRRRLDVFYREGEIAPGLEIGAIR